MADWNNQTRRWKWRLKKENNCLKNLRQIRPWSLKLRLGFHTADSEIQQQCPSTVECFKVCGPRTEMKLIPSTTQTPVYVKAKGQSIWLHNSGGGRRKGICHFHLIITSYMKMLVLAYSGWTVEDQKPMQINDPPSTPAHPQLYVSSDTTFNSSNIQGGVRRS